MPTKGNRWAAAQIFIKANGSGTTNDKWVRITKDFLKDALFVSIIFSGGPFNNADVAEEHEVNSCVKLP
jgi:hypothetical protein